jgi:hypothetical protein
MVPNGTFKSLSECVDNQWIRSDEQYFALMSDNKARVSNNFFGDVKFGNKDPVLTSAMTPTKLDDFDALKIAMVDTTDVFGEASDFYLTFETPDGQPYKVADNIMIAKPTNYDSLHPS